jgi:hypothetical protein
MRGFCPVQQESKPGNPFWSPANSALRAYPDDPLYGAIPNELMQATFV